MQHKADLSINLKTTVFYDGACPLCGREIAHYQRLRGADELLWVNIANNDATLMAYGLDRETAMRRFHVMDSHGNWQTGAYAFAELWSQLPAYRWLAAMLKKLRLLGAMDALYSRFARWRYRSMCSGSRCHGGAESRQ